MNKNDDNINEIEDEMVEMINIDNKNDNKMFYINLQIWWKNTLTLETKVNKYIKIIELK